MSTPHFDRIVFTGASGAVGAHLVRDLAAAHPEAEIICIVRGESAATRLARAVGEDLLERLEVATADLTSAEAMESLTERTAPAGRVLAIHCAADVSWTKSERLLAPINVGGTECFAEYVRRTSVQRPCLVMLSTAFLSDEGAHRNAYEKTKLTAENLLLDGYARDVDLLIVRCSLIVGASSNGHVSRFNGLYPLVRLVALAEVPCVVADRRYKIDVVPVDFVASEIRTGIEQCVASGSPLRIVAAAGDEKSIDIGVLVREIQARTNRMRQRHGLDDAPSVSVISRRQYDFLMRASETWDMGSRFEKVEQISALMEGYIAHGESGRAIEPLTISPPLFASDYLDNVIDYWLDQNLARVLAAGQPQWLEPEALT
jgi:thioester reductase-like protein